MATDTLFLTAIASLLINSIDSAKEFLVEYRDLYFKILNAGLEFPPFIRITQFQNQMAATFPNLYCEFSQIYNRGNRLSTESLLDKLQEEIIIGDSQQTIHTYATQASRGRGGNKGGRGEKGRSSRGRGSRNNRDRTQNSSDRTDDSKGSQKDPSKSRYCWECNEINLIRGHTNCNQRLLIAARKALKYQKVDSIKNSTKSSAAQNSTIIQKNSSRSFYFVQGNLLQQRTNYYANLITSY